MNKSDWAKLPSERVIDETVEALKKNGINSFVVKNREEAKEKVLEMVPEGSEVFTATSISLEQSGISKEINESGKYDSIRNKLNSMDRATQGREMQKIGAAPDYVIGSVHAVTQDGKVVIASNTGSQMAPYVYGAAHVIWVVGTEKIVKDLDSALERIYNYILPLETKRLQSVYKTDMQSFVSKLLVFNREPNATRITLVFVNEELGF